MTAHRVLYEGPSSFAVRAATMLADAPGIELTSAGTPQPSAEVAGQARLTLTVEGTSDAVQAAVTRIQTGMPAEARIAILAGEFRGD